MASPFARSIRSIEADKFSLSIVTSSIAAVVIVLWAVWFFFAQITIYVDSNQIDVVGNGYVRTMLSANEAKNIKQGQPAIIQFDGEIGEQFGVVDAFVNEIARDTEITELELYTPKHYRQLDSIINEGVSGVIRVQVETISPAGLILRAMGQTSDTPSFMSGPQ